MATCYEYHGSWYIQWSENKKRKKEWIGRVEHVSRSQAELRAKAKELELATGKVVYSTVPTFSEFVPEYLDWHASEYPSSYYRVEQIIKQHLEPEFGFLPLDYIKTRNIEIYKQNRRKQRLDEDKQIAIPKNSTITKELRTLRAVLNRALYLEIIDKMPFSYIDEPQSLDSKPPLFYTVEQLENIYAADPQYRYVWQLFANTGMRRSEAYQLKRENVHKNFIRVVSTDEERTKSGLWRDIPITHNARVALDRLEGEDYVLPRITKESLSRAAIRISTKIGLNGSIHTFRHTYISHLVMAGVNLRTVQKLAGHAHYSTTERYAHLAPGHLQEAGTRINL